MNDETQKPEEEEVKAAEGADAPEAAEGDAPAVEVDEATEGFDDGESLSFQEIEDDNDQSDVFDPNEGDNDKDLTAIYDVPVQISAVLGRSSMLVSQLLKLGRGAVVDLDRRVGEPIDIFVNNRLVARGEVVVVEDKLGITMTEIIKSENI